MRTFRLRAAALAASMAAALALTACTSGAAPTTTGGAGATQAASVLSTANIDKVIATYTGPDSKLPKTFGTPTKKALKVGWSAPRIANELVGRLGSVVEKEIKAQGGTVTTLDADADVAKQVSQMQQFVNDKMDAIVVWPLDATALGPVVKQAKAAGIPVIAMEASPQADGDIGDFTGQVIYGRDLGAYVAASLMAEINPKAKVAVGRFAVPVPSIVYYADRAKYWAEQKGLSVVGIFDNPSDDIAGGESMAGPILAANPELKGFLNYNDATAMGVSAAAKSASRGITSFGQNGEDAGVDAVTAGTSALTYQPPVVQIGKELVAGAYLAQAGQTIPKTVYTGPGTFITKDNVAGAKKMGDLIAAAYPS